MNWKILLVFILSFWLCHCSSFLYYPSRSIYVDVKKLKIPPVENKLMIKDGKQSLSLISWLFEVESPKARVVQFHGNGENLSSHFRSFYWVLNHDISLLAFDYPGYGGSEGHPTPKNTVTSGLAALRFAASLEPQVPLVVVGQSIGGAVAMRSIIDADEDLRSRVVLMVIEASFDSYRRIGRSILARSWLTWPFQWLAHLVLSDNEAPRDHLDRLHPIPLLVLHEKGDPIVPSEFSEKLFDRLPNPKSLHLFEGRGHASSFYADPAPIARQIFLDALRERGID